jgi:hypothetical protein
MILPKELNRLILQYVESPRIPDLLYQCWMDQLEYGQGYFCTKTVFLIQPSGPRGRTTFSGGWSSHIVFRITRQTFANDEEVYKYDLEVVWNQDGNALSVFSVEFEEDCGVFAFDVLDSMPRSCKGPPDYFVGHVWEIEVDTTVFRNKRMMDHDHLYHGGFSFDANAMLELVESPTPEDLLLEA